MMKRALLLFARKSIDTGEADPQRLADLLTAANKGLEIAWACFDELIFYLDEKTAVIEDCRNGRLLTDYDVVYFRYWDEQGHVIATARFCKLRAIPYIDSEVLRVGSQNKLTQYMNLYEAGIPFPRSLIVYGPRAHQAYKKYEFSFPLIMKDISGTRGQDNYLVKSPQEIERITARHTDMTFVLQEFIPNDRDYRVIVMGEEVKMVIERRAAPGSHLNNTSQGGKARMVPLSTLPREVLRASVKAAKFFGREVAGVDMVLSLTDATKYYCLEVNRAPQIETATFTGEKAEILADYLLALAA